MRAALWTLAVLVLPGAWFIAQCEGIRWLGGGGTPRVLRPVVGPLSRLGRRLHRARTEEPLPPVLLGLELRRLEEVVRRIEEGRQPHRAARLAAALAAYDHVLIELCRSAEVDAPSGLPPLSSHARLQLEAELVATGVDW
ncbi:MAG TPA: hypothetical protein VFL46_02470 [Phycicoccus sp.]|nr:hypothetical protein [Phycicoccus sp.]